MRKRKEHFHLRLFVYLDRKFSSKGEVIFIHMQKSFSSRGHLGKNLRFEVSF